jgi:hypothetical protein
VALESGSGAPLFNSGRLVLTTQKRAFEYYSGVVKTSDVHRPLCKVCPSLLLQR